MVTTLALLVTLSCRPLPVPPPQHVSRCEGLDRVTRDAAGFELRRQPLACTTVQCEGADSVRRTFDGAEVSRAPNACVVTQCEGGDLVQRRHDGMVIARHRFRCAPPPRQPTSEVLRYGLSSR
jgi:hypothetical protein